MSDGAVYIELGLIEKERDEQKARADKLEQQLQHANQVITATRASEIEAQESVEALTAERDHLLKRQDAHLRLIAQMSKESIDEDEAKELRGQMAALIAEVGTLRSRVEELEKAR